MTEVTGIPTRNGLLRFDRAQVLSDSQKLIAQANIGIASALAGFAVLNGGNTFNGNQIVNGNVQANGNVSANQLIASNPSGIGPSPYLSAVNSFSEATLELRNNATNGYTKLNLGSLVASGSIAVGAMTLTGGSPAEVNGGSSRLTFRGNAPFIFYRGANSFVVEASGGGVAAFEGGITAGGYLNSASLDVGTIYNDATVALSVASNRTWLFNMYNAGGTHRSSLSSAGHMAIGGATATSNQMLRVSPNGTGVKGLVVQGTASQVANYYEAQNNVGTVEFSVAPGGNLTASGTVTSNQTGFSNAFAWGAGSYYVRADGLISYPYWHSAGSNTVLTNGTFRVRNAADSADANATCSNLTASGKIRSDAAIVGNNGVQGTSGPSLEMGFTNYGIGANANGEPVSIINGTVRNRLGVDVVVGNNGSFGFGSAAHAGMDSTVDTKITRYAPQTISVANASNTAGFVARADNGRILVGYDPGGDYLASGNVLGTALPLYIGSGIHSMIRFVPNDITIPSGGQIRSLGSQSSRLYLTEGFGLGTGFSFAGYNSTAPAMTYYMEPSGAWTLRQKLGSIIAWTDNGSTAGSGSSITSTLSQASAGTLQIGTTSNNPNGNLNLAAINHTPTTAPTVASGVSVYAGASSDLYFKSAYSSCYLQMGGAGSTLASANQMQVSGAGGVYLGRNPQADNTRTFIKVVDANNLSLRNAADSADINLKAASYGITGYTLGPSPSVGGSICLLNTTAGNEPLRVSAQGTTFLRDNLHMNGSAGEAGIVLQQAGVSKWQIYDASDRLRVYNHALNKELFSINGTTETTNIGATNARGLKVGNAVTITNFVEVNPDKVTVQGDPFKMWGYQSSFMSLAQSSLVGTSGAGLDSPGLKFVGGWNDASTEYSPFSTILFKPTGANSGSLIFNSSGYEGLRITKTDNRPSVLQVNSPTISTAMVNITTSWTGKKGLLVQGVASQTENLIEAQNSAGSAVFSVGPTGNITGVNLTVGGEALHVNQGTGKTTLYNNGVLGWTNAGSAQTSAVTGFSQVSAGVVALGNGTQGNTSGTLQLSKVRSFGTTDSAQMYWSDVNVAMTFRNAADSANVPVVASAFYTASSGVGPHQIYFGTQTAIEGQSYAGFGGLRMGSGQGIYWSSTTAFSGTPDASITRPNSFTLQASTALTSKPRSATVSPNTTDLPSGFAVWWHDTVGNGRRYAYNDGGVIFQSPLLKSSTPATPADLAGVISVLQHWGLCD